MREDCLVYNINLVVSIVIRTQDIHDLPERHPVGRARAGRGTKTRSSVTDAGPTHALRVRNAGQIAIPRHNEISQTPAQKKVIESHTGTNRELEEA